MIALADLEKLPRPVFFFDENIPERIPKGFREFGEQSYHLTEVLPAGTPDLVWIPIVGGSAMTLVTMDAGLRRNPSEREAYRDNNVGGFALKGKDPSVWDLVGPLVKSWQEMKTLAVATAPPFIFRVRIGGRVEKPPLRL